MSREEQKKPEAATPDNHLTEDENFAHYFHKIIYLTQDGLPITQRPYEKLAEQLELDQTKVIQILKKMLEIGLIRRISAVPNHYALGYRYNLMTVWNVPDSEVEHLGFLAASLDFVSHCYQRPRQLPDWPYNLFVMIHGRSQTESENKFKHLQSLFAADTEEYCILKSTQILKKAGLRLHSPNMR